jgi:hypothetical protein
MEKMPLSQSVVKKIIIAGLIVGTLDIVAAFIDAGFLFILHQRKCLTE